MNEDTKVKVVSNDLIRRLMNTSIELGEEEKVKVVNQYGQNLANSGYGMEQLRRIIASGIRVFGSKVARCYKEGRHLRWTARESLTNRIRRKRLSKTTWYRGRKQEVSSPPD